MLHESYLGHLPSHFNMNPVVKSFIISETFLWSSITLVTPIFAVFAATKIPHGNLEVAATAFSLYLAVRVIFELFSAKVLSKRVHKNPVAIICLGISFVSLAYFGLSITNTVIAVYLLFALKGIGIGIASPMKNALFSSHIDKAKAPMEWSIHDAITLLGMAFASAVGGVIAGRYGFSTLFVVAAIVSAMGILPYLKFLNNKGSVDITK